MLLLIYQLVNILKGLCMSLFRKLFCSFLFSSFFILNFVQAAEINLIASKEEWQKFTAKDNGFSVEFPKKPTHVEQKIDIPQTDLSIRYDTYLSEPDDTSVYVVSVWYYPPQVDMSKPDVNLQDGFQGMLSALPGAKVMKSEKGDTDGFKTLEFQVKHENIYFQGKLILVYNTLYQVFTVYKEGASNMKDNYNRFINSFTLLEPDENKPQPLKDNTKKVHVMLETF